MVLMPSSARKTLNPDQSFAPRKRAGLWNVTIPDTVIGIGSFSFNYCSGLQYACFEGNVPTGPGNAVIRVAPAMTNVFYVPGTAGWEQTYSGIPTAPCVACEPLSFLPRLNPPLLLGNGGLQFRFTYPSGASFTVFAASNVALPFDQWTDLGAAVETPPGSGQYQFTDPQTTNYVQRYYRVESQ